LIAPWIHFEAGAIARAVMVEKEGRLWTYLLDVKHADVQGPLSQFQHTLATIGRAADPFRGSRPSQFPGNLAFDPVISWEFNSSIEMDPLSIFLLDTKNSTEFTKTSESQSLRASATNLLRRPDQLIKTFIAQLRGNQWQPEIKIKPGELFSGLNRCY
jgi:hypothetical protein